MSQITTESRERSTLRRIEYNMNQSRMRDRYLSQIRRLGSDLAQSGSEEEELYERLEAVRFQVKIFREEFGKLRSSYEKKYNGDATCSKH